MNLENENESLPSPLLNSKGQGLTEYLMLVLLIAVVSIGATKTLGNTVKIKLQQVRRQINENVTFSENDS